MACPTILQTFILLAVLTNLTVAMPTTPPPCAQCSVTCSDGTKPSCTAWCDNKGFSEVPAQCNHVYDLRISDNSISHITVTTFESFHHLEILKMKNNGIDTVDEGSFAQTELYTIDLSDNVLQTLSGDVFRNLTTTLTHLKVAGNRISSIERYNLPNLTYLDMSDNEIQEIQRSSFSMMTNIKILKLARNHITQLGNNFLGSSVKDVAKLDLSGNEISDVNSKAFNFLTRLEELDLSDNAITDLYSLNPSLGFFETQSYLKVLSLSNNQISSLNINMLKGLQNNLTELNVDNNQISTIEAGIFRVLRFQNLAKLNLTNNNIDSNFSKEMVPLLRDPPTTKIQLKRNPICEEYQTVFQGHYNKSIFCSLAQLKKYLEYNQNTGTTSPPHQTADSVPQIQPTIGNETLKIFCMVSGGVLLVLLVILFFVWIKSKQRRTGNYTTCVTNRGYQYPDEDTSQPERPPPPIPVREPLLDESYANTSTMCSYITPNNQPSTNKYLPSTNGHPPSTNRHPPSTNRHLPSTNGHPPSTDRHPPSTHRHPPSTRRHSFRKSILKRLPSLPHKNQDQPIVVIGTTHCTTNGTTRIEGLPLCKSIIKKSTSHTYKKPIKTPAPRNEEEPYLMRDETEDGKPKDSTMASYRSVQD